VALKNIRHVPNTGHKLVPPIVAFTIESAARGEFEFSFGREPLVGPVAVHSGVCHGRATRGQSSGFMSVRRLFLSLWAHQSFQAGVRLTMCEVSLQQVRFQFGARGVHLYAFGSCAHIHEPIDG
jgi:hypothetical protein